MSSCIIVFVKNAELGKVKTRLAKGIGAEAALDAYKQLTAYTKSVIDGVPLSGKQIWYSSRLEEFDIWSEGIYEKRVQHGDDLGARMNTAFKRTLEDDGYRKVVVIGSDCADLTDSILDEAFQQLENHDVVIGPAYDGGYYLIGLSSYQPTLFEDKEWSTDHVYQDALDEIEKLKLSFYALPTLSDVDTIEDWEKVKARLADF